jgi:ankyrin repeat protein
LEIVRLLIENGGLLNVNARDVYGCTALHLACEEDRQDVAKLLVLVQNGGDLDSKNRDGLTPLELCTMHLKKALEIIKSKIH